MDKQRKDNRGLIIPKWITYFIKTLDFLNPYLCMRFAGYLWTRPIKYKVPEREIPILKSCNTSILKIKSINKKIQFYRWKGKGPKVLLVHGWSGRASNMFCIIERLIEKDYDIYSFDAPAHGNSPSKTTNIPEFIACINELHLHIKSIDAIIAYSGGAFASIYCSCFNNKKLKKLVLISPFNSVYDLFQNFFNLIQLSKKVGDLMIEFYSQKTGIKIDENLSAEKFGKNLKCETLIIHDKDDKEIPFEDSQLIAKSIKNVKTFFTKNLGHRRILRDEKVVKEILTFINN